MKVQTSPEKMKSRQHALLLVCGDAWLTLWKLLLSSKWNVVPWTFLSILPFILTFLLSHHCNSQNTILSTWQLNDSLIWNCPLRPVLTHDLLPSQMWCVRPLHRLTLCCWWTVPGVLGVSTSRPFVRSSPAWLESLTLAQRGSKLVSLLINSNCEYKYWKSRSNKCGVYRSCSVQWRPQDRMAFGCS